MLEGYNRAAVRRLSKVILFANPLRNGFVIAAVALTTLLLTAVFSIGINLIQNTQTGYLRMQGSVSSIYLEHPSIRQTGTLKDTDYLRSVGTQIAMGKIPLQETGRSGYIGLMYYDKTEWKDNYKPAIWNLTGRYPEQPDEIMLSEPALNLLGISEPSLGMGIPLAFEDMNGQKRELVFVLSGWFREYGAAVNGVLNERNASGFVSEAYQKQSGLTAQSHGMLSISVRAGTQDNTLKKLAAQYPFSFLTTPDIREDVLRTDILAGGTILVVMGLFIFLGGYMLVYNVYFISVTRDIRLYGMLKSLGATGRQIKQIVNWHTLVFCAAGIPAGLLMGVQLAFLIVPVFIGVIAGDTLWFIPNDVSLHPLIYLATVAFAVLTAYTGCRRSARIARNISPVDAARYIPGGQTTRRRRRTFSGGKPVMLALHNVLRGRLRMAIVLASLFFGATSYLGVYAFIHSLNTTNFIDMYYPDDFRIYDVSLSGHLDQDFFEALMKIDGVETVSGCLQDDIVLDVDESVRRAFAKDDYSFRFPADITFEQYYSRIRPEPCLTRVFGIDPSYLEQYNRISDNPVDRDAFERGDVVLAGYLRASDAPTLLEGADGVSLTSLATGAVTEARLAGFASEKNGYSELPFARYATAQGAPAGIFAPRQTVLELNPQAAYSEISINAEPYKEARVSRTLERLLQDYPEKELQMDVRSQRASNLRAALSTLNITGGAVCSILFLIGILNFINVMMTGIYARMKEFAVMESIGASRKQIRSLLVLEGVYYAVGASFLILTLGSVVISLISNMTIFITGYATFYFPWGMILLLCGIIFAVCISVPLIVYQVTSKQSITDRLRIMD